MRSALALVALIGCNPPEGEDHTITINNTVTEPVPHQTTVTETNTVFVPTTPEVVVYPDVLTPVFVFQPYGLLGAYSHLLDLDLDGAGHLATAAFYPNVIDISDPAAVTTTGSFVEADSVAGRHHWVAVDGDEILVDGIKSALRRFSIQADGSMVEEANWPSATDRIQYGSDLENDRAYIALSQGGVSIRDRETLAIELGVIPAPDAVDVTVVDNTAYVLDRTLGFTTWDVTDAAAPVQLGALFLEGGYNSMTIEGGLAVVSAANFVHLIDLADLTAPAVCSSIETDSGVALRADVEGGTLVFAEYNDWQVWNITDPENPVFIGLEDAYDAALSVRIDGTRVYVGDWDLLKAYDLDPTASAPEIAYDWPLYVVAPAGFPAQAVEVVTNKGTQPLVVSNILCPVEGVSVSPTAFTLAPGASQALTVDLAFVMPSGDTHTCTILSDDPDEPAAPLQIEVNRDGLGVGELAPLTVLPDLDGNMHDLQADYMGTDTDADGVIDTGGKIVYVHLFSSNCQQCVSSMAAVQAQINEAFAGDPNFVSVSLDSSVVGLEDPTYLAEFTEGYGLTHDQVWVDWAQPAVAYYQWTITSTEAFAPYPRHFVVGRDGLIKYASYEADLGGAIQVLTDELAAL